MYTRSKSIDGKSSTGNSLNPTPKMARIGNLLRRSTSIFERSSFFSTGHVTSDEESKEEQRALKTAFYNTAALVFVGVLFYTCTQVFYMLEFCIRPLLWALLFGAVLYPVKELGKHLIITGIDTLTESRLPLVLGLVILPFYTLQRFLLWVGTVTITTYKEMISSLLIILAILLTDMVDIIDMCNDLIVSISFTAGYGLEILEQYNYVVWTLAVGYLVLVCVWWRPGSGGYYQAVEWLAMPIWALSIATMISYLGQWRDYIAICVFSVLGCGTYAALTNYKTAKEESGSGNGSATTGPATKNGVPQEDDVAMTTPAIKKVKVKVDLVEETPHSSSTPLQNIPRPYTTPAANKTTNKTRYQTPATSRRPIKQASLKFLENNNRISTDKYFSLLGWTVLFTLIGRDVFFVLRLACLLIIFLATCQLCRVLRLTERLQEGASKICTLMSESGSRFSVLCPQSLRGLAILMMKGQNVVLGVLRRSTNQVVSGSIVVLMILAILLISCFILYTVHSEVLYLLQATSYFINSHTSYHLQSLDSSLGDISVGLSSAHSAGRGWIKSKIAILPEGPNTKDLENTLLSLYDNMYQQWVQRNVSSTRTNVTMNHLLTTVKGNMNSLDLLSLHSLKSNLAHLLSGSCVTSPGPDIAIANYVLCSKGMIVDVLNSLWTVFSSNMALLLKLVFNLASGLVEGGAAFLNFLVQLVVFITALYYLLIYSDVYYAPVEIMTSLLPTTVERAEYTSALFDATRGIFGASFKLSVFYSCYVWVSHTLFGLEMVFVPALLAGLLSLIPVVGVYWSSVPGFLVLWLVEDRFLRALVFMLLQILPTYFIDMAVYSEIEGGWHPYITGLAVAGGMYYFGLEGAIIGPLVICILKFIINLYESVFDDMSQRTSPEHRDNVIE